jgi:hypothetical protein
MFSVKLNEPLFMWLAVTVLERRPRWNMNCGKLRRGVI